MIDLQSQPGIKLVFAKKLSSEEIESLIEAMRRYNSYQVQHSVHNEREFFEITVETTEKYSETIDQAEMIESYLKQLKLYLEYKNIVPFEFSMLK